MRDYRALGRELLAKVDGLAVEIQEVYVRLVLPGWGGPLHGLPNTLYGYMMVCFSRIDFLSKYWVGATDRKGQTRRMIDFMERYMSADREAASAAVQIWRHQLMHLGEPKQLTMADASVTYRWLLHWGQHLPREQHFTMRKDNPDRILNLGLIYLVEDLRRGVSAYASDLESNAELQSKHEEAGRVIASPQFRQY